MKKKFAYIDNERFKKIIFHPNINHNEICINFFTMAQNLCQMYRWRDSTQQEDAVSTAVTHCITLLERRTFIPAKHSSPFCYFTTVIRNSYYHTIQNDKKYSMLPLEEWNEQDNSEE